MDKFERELIECDYCGETKARRRAYTTLEGNFCNPDCAMDFVLDKETKRLDTFDWLDPARWALVIAIAFIVVRCVQSGMG